MAESIEARLSAVERALASLMPVLVMQYGEGAFGELVAWFEALGAKPTAAEKVTRLQAEAATANAEALKASAPAKLPDPLKPSAPSASGATGAPTPKA